MTSTTRACALIALVALVAFTPATAQVGVIPHHNDLARTGQKTRETHVNPAFNIAWFGKLCSAPLEGAMSSSHCYHRPWHDPWAPR